MKHKFPHLFRFYYSMFDLIKHIKLPDQIIELIYSYINNRYIYKDIFIYKNDLQFIFDIGIQLKDDDECDEFYIRPIFLCNKCLIRYDHYCIFQNKFI